MVQGWLGIKHHDMLHMDGVSMDLSMGLWILDESRMGEMFEEQLMRT